MNTNLMIGRSIPAEEYKEIRRQERAEMDRIQEQIDNWSNPREIGRASCRERV